MCKVYKKTIYRRRNWDGKLTYEKNLTSNLQNANVFKILLFTHQMGKKMYMSVNIKCWLGHRETCSHALLVGAWADRATLEGNLESLLRWKRHVSMTQQISFCTCLPMSSHNYLLLCIFTSLLCASPSPNFPLLMGTTVILL